MNVFVFVIPITYYYLLLSYTILLLPCFRATLSSSYEHIYPLESLRVQQNINKGP